jgi:hypothetical protein
VTSAISLRCRFLPTIKKIVDKEVATHYHCAVSTVPAIAGFCVFRMEEVRIVRFVQLILGLLVVIFVLFTLGNAWPWGRWALLILGLLLIVLAFARSGRQPAAPVPAPKPKPEPQPKPEPAAKPAAEGGDTE